MKILFLILLITFVTKGFCQGSVDSMMHDVCVYKTGDNKFSKGINMKLKIPCSWYDAQGDRPGAALNYRYQINGGLQLTNCMLVLERPGNYTNKEKMDLVNMELMRKEMSKQGTVKNIRKVVINGEQTSEIEMMQTMETPTGTAYISSLIYSLAYKNKLILLSYMVGSYEKVEATTYLEKYKRLFRALASDAVLLNKWK